VFTAKLANKTIALLNGGEQQQQQQQEANGTF